MSELYFFTAPDGSSSALALPFAPQTLIADWASLRSAMVRQHPALFTRDEWAYLIDFIAPQRLQQVFNESFGLPITAPTHRVTRLYRPKGQIALWLPNNVSLLGPLTLVLLSLTGAPLRIKSGSQSDNLTSEFIQFITTHLAPESALYTYVQHQVFCAAFVREDPRNAEMAATSAVRITFGSDHAAEQINALPHPMESVACNFIDRQSQIWIEPEAIDDALVDAIIRIFSIYGQAGCTSPKSIMLLDGSLQQAAQLAEGMLRRWPALIRHDPAPYMASNNRMLCQWAAALGWSAAATPRQDAVIAWGEGVVPLCTGPRFLPIIAIPRERVLATLPENIQTIGHALIDPHDVRWLQLLATTPVKRFVPVRMMHHFGALWDGMEFWRNLFEVVEVRS